MNQFDVQPFLRSYLQWASKRPIKWSTYSFERSHKHTQTKDDSIFINEWNAMKRVKHMPRTYYFTHVLFGCNIFFSFSFFSLSQPKQRLTIKYEFLTFKGQHQDQFTRTGSLTIIFLSLSLSKCNSIIRIKHYMCGSCEPYECTFYILKTAIAFKSRQKSLKTVFGAWNSPMMDDFSFRFRMLCHRTTFMNCERAPSRDSNQTTNSVAVKYN